MIMTLQRKLIHLKSIAKRAISSLEAGIKEFDAFINDVDEGQVLFQYNFI